MKYKYTCTTCGEKVPRLYLEKEEFELDERTIPVYKLIFGSDPDPAISKFKVLSHSIRDGKVTRYCGPVVREKEE